jgi:hypothetical protein
MYEREKWKCHNSKKCFEVGFKIDPIEVEWKVVFFDVFLNNLYWMDFKM